jgi:hypothetical protein
MGASEWHLGWSSEAPASTSCARCRARHAGADRGASPGASSEEIKHAFWQACAGGQRRAAELLLAHGADLNWVPDYAKGTPLDQAGSIDTGRAALVSWLQERGARSAHG